MNCKECQIEVDVVFDQESDRWSILASSSTISKNCHHLPWISSICPALKASFDEAVEIIIVADQL